jgi:hypothetical protein
VANVPAVDKPLPHVVLVVTALCMLPKFFDDLYKEILEWKRISEVPGHGPGVSDVLLDAQERKIDEFIATQYGRLFTFSHVNNEDVVEVFGIWKNFSEAWKGKDKRLSKDRIVSRLAFVAAKMPEVASSCYWEVANRWPQAVADLKISVGAVLASLKVLTRMDTDANTITVHKQKIIQEVAKLKQVLPTLTWFSGSIPTWLATEACPKWIKSLEDFKWSEALNALEKDIMTPVADLSRDKIPQLMGFRP